MKPEMSRRLRAVLRVLEKSVAELSENWGVDRSHLIAIMEGRSAMGDDVASTLSERTGISAAWLRSGEEPVFTGKSPGPAVEKAIANQLLLGGPGVGGIPVFENVEQARAERPSSGVWLEYARRGVMPVSVAREKGFFVVADEEGAETAGCAVGDFLLCVPPEYMFRRSRISVGDRVLCILKAGRRQRLGWLEIVATKPRRKAGKEQVKPSRSEYDVLFEGKKVYYCLRHASERGRTSGREEIMAVALKAEKDLVRRSGG